MNINELQKVDHRELNKNAVHLFEISDNGGLLAWFGNCENVQDINKTADKIAAEYPELMEV